MKNRIGLGLSGRLLSLLLIALSLGGCSGEKKVSSSVKPEPISVFDPMTLALPDADLIHGREIWMPTCGQCHIRGLGGAPKIGDQAAWAPRIAQGKEVLYEHAIHGFTSPQLNEMSAKGGFTELTDSEVKLAVDFVVFASKAK